MNRPIYETPEDLSREANVADAMAQAWDCEVVKLPRMYPADFVMYKGGRARSWLEIKVRNYRSGTFPTYHLSTHKVVSLNNLATTTDVPAILVVRLTDVLLFHRIMPPYGVEPGGRKDRGDPQDLEPVCAIPFGEFSEVKINGR